MLSVLQKTTSFIGIPCAVLFILFVFLKRKNAFFTWGVLIVLTIILFWRTYIPKASFSSRYCSVLIYPAIIISSYTLVHIGKSINKGTVLSSLLQRMLPVALFLYYIIYNLQFDLNSSNYLAIANTFSRYPVPTYSDIFVSHSWNETKRFSHYTRIPSNRIISIKTDSLSDLIKQIDQYRNYNGPLFFLDYNEVLPYNILSEEYLSKRKSLVILLFHNTSSKHKKAAYIFRYIPEQNNVKEIASTIPRESQDISFENGDFETPLSGRDLDNYKKALEKYGQTYYLSHDLPLPKRITLGLFANNAVNPPLICLSAVNPISGHYSLLIDTTHTNNSATFSYQGIKKGDYIYSGIVKGIGTTPATLTVKPYFFDHEKKDTVYLDTISFNILPDKTYQFYGTVSSADIVSSSFSLYFVGSGKFLLDNLDLTPFH